MTLKRIGPGNWAYCLKKAKGNPATAAALMKEGEKQMQEYITIQAHGRQRILMLSIKEL